MAKRLKSQKRGEASPRVPSPEDESVAAGIIFESKPSQKGLNIAVIGGGTRCKALLEMFAADRFKSLKAQIVGVADINPEAPGLLFAKEKGIYTTNDCHDFLHMENLDVVIELTGKEELLRDVLKHKRPDLPVCDYAISRLISDMVTFRGEYKVQERDLDFSQRVIDSLLQTLWKGTTQAIFLLKPNYLIVDANEPMLKQLGMPKDEVIGRTCHEISHGILTPCNSSSCYCPLQETLRSGLSAHAIHEHLDRENKLHYVEVSTFPLKNYRGEVTMIFELSRDITDELELRLEQRTLKIKQDLAKLVHEDKMIALGKLVASSVHEINNPIAGIHTLARLMLRSLDEGPPGRESLDEFRRYLGLVADESARCGQIVSNLLSFSRQNRLEQQRLNVNHVVQSVVVLVHHKMELQKIAVEENLAENLPEIQGDQNQIQQCLMNLVFNAMEAMPTGGKLTVTTSFDRQAKKVEVLVIDTGCGIPAENLSSIFEPFFSTKTKDKGVGLGLSVVYGIIREHRGTIYVESTVGEGSTFKLRFPAVIRDDPASANG